MYPNALSEQRATLSYLVFSSLATTHDFQIKIEGETGQRVIGIHFDQVAVDSYHLYHLSLIAGVGLKFHAHIQVFNALKQGTGHLAHQVLAVFAVGHFRWHGHFQAVTHVTVFHRLLNAGNDLGAAVDKVQRLAAFRRIHQLTDAVLEHVMDGKNIRPGVRVIGLHQLLSLPVFVAGSSCCRPCITSFRSSFSRTPEGLLNPMRSSSTACWPVSSSARMACQRVASLPRGVAVAAFSPLRAFPKVSSSSVKSRPNGKAGNQSPLPGAARAWRTDAGVLFCQSPGKRKSSRTLPAFWACFSKSAWNRESAIRISARKTSSSD